MEQAVVRESRESIRRTQVGWVGLAWPARPHWRPLACALLPLLPPPLCAATATTVLQVVDPKIKAFMYTWGEGRVTAEGERIPGAVQGQGRACGGLSTKAFACCSLAVAALGTRLPFPQPITLLLSAPACLPAVRCEPLDIGYIDGMLLLPLIIEHTIGGSVGGAREREREGMCVWRPGLHCSSPHTSPSDGSLLLRPLLQMSARRCVATPTTRSWL